MRSIPIPAIAALAAVALGFTQPAAAHPNHHQFAAAAGGGDRPAADASEMSWWRGNLHTHTLWSDGNDYPEMVVEWYKHNGYHFLALSDHNILSQGQKWIVPATSRFASGAGADPMAQLDLYRQRFGDVWVETRENDEGELEVRLKPLGEFRHFFEEPGRFLMIQSEEITDHKTVHVNATNILEFIPPQRGETTTETIQNNVDAVLEQRQHTGQSMFPHLNHPNFRWAVTAEDMAAVDGLQFFEVYNGHPATFNMGDEYHVGLDRMWDIILTQRLGETERGIVYGLAVDDAHRYHGAPVDSQSYPGRGWVMVRAAFLTPEHIVHAMEAGDFYSTTGVTVSDFGFDGRRLTIEIEPEEGVTYRTLFIGTRQGYDASSEPVVGEDGEEMLVTRRYSDDIGQVLAEVEGISPGYELQGDEIYVRAKIISDKPKAEGFRSAGEEFEVAWIQPVVPQDPAEMAAE